MVKPTENELKKIKSDHPDNLSKFREYCEFDENEGWIIDFKKLPEKRKSKKVNILKRPVSLTAKATL